MELYAFSQVTITWYELSNLGITTLVNVVCNLMCFLKHFLFNVFSKAFSLRLVLGDRRIRMERPGAINFHIIFGCMVCFLLDY